MRRVAKHLDRYSQPLTPLSLYGDSPSTPAYTPPAWNQCHHGSDFPPRCTATGTHRLTDEDIAYRRRRPELNFVDPATLRWCGQHCRGWHIRAERGVMRKTTVELGNMGTQEFDATGARALTMMLDREYRAEHAPTDAQRELWTARAEEWRRFALECWTYAAEAS